MAPPGSATWGPPGQVAWAAPGFYTGVKTELRHRPGAGAVVAFVGLLLIAVSLFGLPWVSLGGQNISFPDIREAFAAADDAGLSGSTADDYVEIYADWLWIVVLVLAAGAIVVSTLFVPRSIEGRMLIGLLSAGVVGAAAMGADKKGTVGPRVCGALLTVVIATLHGLALQQFFDDAGASPAYGAWTGVAGFAVLLVGCLMGTNVER